MIQFCSIKSARFHLGTGTCDSIGEIEYDGPLRSKQDRADSITNINDNEVQPLA